ncbi:MAG: NHL repeat-containing protein [Bacteroidota bacterium]|nr:NHL repeat-containing protein [Bacteroidota bacterium]
MFIFPGFILLAGIFTGTQASGADSSHQPVFVVERSFGTFADAVSLSTNGSGDFFVVDAGADKLYQLSESDGNIKSIGGKGWGDLEFDQPSDVCASFPLDVYVADYNNRRVQRFDRKLNLIQSFTEENLPSSSNGSFYPRACAMSLQGELFVVESESDRILKFDQNQNFQKEFGSYSAGAGTLKTPRDISINSGDTVFILDEHRVVEFDIFGNYVGSIALPQADTALALSTFGGGVLVSMASAIAAYSSDGTPLFIITRSRIVGFPPPNGLHQDEEIRDALLLSSKLFILTNHTILMGNTAVGKER